nr:MAG TPA: hypothetical protein [Bacteriophage sp.]
MIQLSPFEAQGNASYFYCPNTTGHQKRCVAGDTDDNGLEIKSDTLKMEGAGK